MRKLGTPLFPDGLPKIDMGLYGEGGTGKTTLLGQFNDDPRTGPTLWVDAQGNPQTLEIQGTKLWGFKLEHYRDVLVAVDFFLNNQPSKHPLRDKIDLPPDLVFKSLTVDTASFLQQRLIDYVVEVTPVRDAKKEGLIQVEATTHGARIAGTFLDLTRKILALPVHTFMSYQYHEKVNFQGTADGKIVGANTIAQVQLYGSSRVIIPPWHNAMGLLVKMDGFDPKTKKPCTVTKVYWRAPDKTGKMQLTDRLPEVMENPTAKEILDAIQESWKVVATN